MHASEFYKIIADEKSTVNFYNFTIYFQMSMKLQIVKNMIRKNGWLLVNNMSRAVLRYYGAPGQTYFGSPVILNYNI
jgi:hypothetical protein